MTACCVGLGNGLEGVLEQVYERVDEEAAVASGDGACAVIHHIAAVELANAIVAQAGPLANSEGARLVAYQSQRKIQALAIPRIAVI